MSIILEDLSVTSITTAIEGNLSSWIPILSARGEAVEDNPPVVRRAINDIPMPLFNGIMDARLTPEIVESTIEFIISDAQFRNVPVLWWIGPSTQPADLATHPENSGFSLDDNSTGMAVDLENLNENLSMPPGLSIQAACDDASWRTCSRTLILGFEAPPDRVDFAITSWHTLISKVDPGTVTPYTAWLDGEPVATQLLEFGAGVAGIYAVSTLPEARRRGIGPRVTIHPLLDTRAMGYKVGILQASEIGLSVYRSLGFKEYCRIRSYVSLTSVSTIQSQAH